MTFEVWDENQVFRVEADDAEEACADVRDRGPDDFERPDVCLMLARAVGADEWETISVNREMSPIFYASKVPDEGLPLPDAGDLAAYTTIGRSTT